MKRKIICVAVLLLSAIPLFSTNEKINIKNIKKQKIADIDGNSKNETINLCKVGSKINTEIKLVIQNEEKKVILEKVVSDFGVSEELFIGDINKDKAKEIMVGFSSGGSAGEQIFTLYKYSDKKLIEIPLPIQDIEAKKFFKSEIKGNKVILSCETLNKTLEYKLSEENKQECEELLKNNEEVGYFNPYYFEIKDIDNDNQDELVANTYFKIGYKNYVAEINIAFKYKAEKWIPVNFTASGMDD